MKTIAALALFSAIAFGQTSPSVALNWTNAPSNPAGTLTNAYRASGACGTTGQTFTKLNTTGITGTTYADSGVARGQTYCYRVTATNGAQESAPSTTADAAIPLAAPSGVTITVNIALTVSTDGVQVASKNFTVTEGQ
jgi:hypothetical protein